MDQNNLNNKKVFQGPFCKVVLKAVKNSHQFSQNRKNCIEKLVLQDQQQTRFSLETIKLIFKSTKFNSQEKDLVESLNQFVVEEAQKILLSRMYQFVIGVPKGSWSKCSEVLFQVSKDKDKKWGLRFYVFLTELLQKLAQEIQPFDHNGQRSAFYLIYKKIQETNLTKQEYIYYDCQLEQLSELDKKFFSIFNIDNNTSKKTSQINNKNVAQNSYDRKQNEQLNKIKIVRKDFLNQIFSSTINKAELLTTKNVYQQLVLQFFEKMEHQLEKQSQNENCIKEMELADNLFEIYDQSFPDDDYSSEGLLQFKKKTCSILQQIYGGYPEKYQEEKNNLPIFKSPQKNSKDIASQKTSRIREQSVEDSKKYLVRNIHQRPKLQRSYFKEKQMIKQQNELQQQYKNREMSQKIDRNRKKPKLSSVGITRVLNEKKMMQRLILKEYQEKEDQFEKMKEKYDRLRKQYEERCYQEYFFNQGKKEEIEKIFDLRKTQKKLRSCYSTKKLRY